MTARFLADLGELLGSATMAYKALTMDLPLQILAAVKPQPHQIQLLLEAAPTRAALSNVASLLDQIDPTDSGEAQGLLAIYERRLQEFPAAPQPSMEQKA